MIRITPEEVRSLAGQYRTQAAAVEDVNSTMESLLAQLQSVWEGAAANAYAAKFEELKPGFVKVVELINEIASGLDSTANTIEQTDQELAASWG